MNNEIDLFRIIIDYKWYSLILLIIFVSKLIKICWKNSPHEEDYIKYELLSNEEKKLFLVTKYNTYLNQNNSQEKDKNIKRSNI